MGVANQTTIIRGGVSATPKITNISTPGTPDTEFTHVFDDATKQFRIKADGL